MATRTRRRHGDGPNAAAPPRGRNVVAVIGIDAYEHWPRLKNAVHDARGALDLFVGKLGFVAPVPPLFDALATRSAIEALVQDQLAAELRDDDSLVLFFAGHGHTQARQVGGKTVETGYLVPAPARRDRLSDCVKIDSLLDDASRLAARHVLVIIDACHSGLALGAAMKTFRSNARYEADLSARLSRKVITSAMRDQPALDNGPVAGHSLFTGTLIDGFNWGAADIDGNALVTSSELGLYLQQRVAQSSGSQQTPDFGSFQLDDRGELVIRLGGDDFDALKARAMGAYQRADFDAFAALLAEVRAQRPDSAEALYLGYRHALLEGRVADALAAIQRLQALRLPAGVIPLTERDLVTLGIQLSFWAPVLALPSAPLPVELSLLAGASADALALLRPAAQAGRRVYDVDDGAILRFFAHNRTPQAVHLYHIVVTPHGRLLMGPLLDSDAHRIDGLPPGGDGIGPPLRIRDAGSLTETRVIASPVRISALLFPGTTATRPLERLDPAQVAALRVQRVWHRVAGPMRAGDGDVPPGFGVPDTLDAAAPPDTLDEAE